MNYFNKSRIYILDKKCNNNITKKYRIYKMLSKIMNIKKSLALGKRKKLIKITKLNVNKYKVVTDLE